MQKQILKYLSIGFCILCLNSISGESYVLPKSFGDLVREADLILEGTVGEKRSEWAEDRSTIYTFITLFDIEVIDGAYEGTTFTLRMDGGEVEDAGRMKGLKIPGTPEFSVGERVVLFVKDNTWDVCPLVGWGQGVLKVKKDPVNGKTKFFSSQNGNEIVGVDGDSLLESPVLQQNFSVIEPEDDDPIANEMRRKHDQTRMAAENKTPAQAFTSQDFKSLIKDRGDTFRLEGKKHNRMVTDADIRVHRKGRAQGHAQLPREEKEAVR